MTPSPRRRQLLGWPCRRQRGFSLGASARATALLRRRPSSPASPWPGTGVSPDTEPRFRGRGRSATGHRPPGPGGEDGAPLPSQQPRPGWQNAPLRPGQARPARRFLESGEPPPPQPPATSRGGPAAPCTPVLTADPRPRRLLPARRHFRLLLGRQRGGGLPKQARRREAAEALQRPLPRRRARGGRVGAGRWRASWAGRDRGQVLSRLGAGTPLHAPQRAASPKLRKPE